MKTPLPFILMLICFTSAYAQKRGATSISGNCNGSATGENITVTVNCGEGISKEDAQKLADQYSAILKTVKDQKLDLKTVQYQLRAIQTGINTILRTADGGPAITQGCTGSCIQIAGDNYAPNTVINQVPEPLSMNEEQAKLITEAMKPFVGTTIRVNETGRTRETRNVTEGLRYAFTQAGVTADVQSAVMNIGMGGMQADPGLTFTIGPNEEAAAVALAVVLRTSGVLPTGRRILLNRTNTPNYFSIDIAPTRS